MIDEVFRPATSNYAALDGLRGFASCIVVFYHCVLFMGFHVRPPPEDGSLDWVFAVSNGFWSGIDIFFVLSGFLIGRMLIADLMKHDQLFYKAFLVRRSYRIFPAYYLVITISLLVIAPMNIPAFNFMFGTADWNALLDTAWANYLYVVNYVSAAHNPSIMSWAWSLCVEEHFYFLLPPLLWLLFKSRSRKVVLAGLLACILIPFLGRAVQYALDPSIKLLHGFYYYSHNRFDEIFVGVLIAYFYVDRRDKLRAFCERAGGLVLGGLGLAGAASVWIFGGLHRDGGMFVVVFQFLIMALATGSILLNTLFLNNRLTQFFSHPFWYPLARISYGTYLVHPFILFGLIQLYSNHYGNTNFDGTWLLIMYALVMLLSSAVAVVMFAVLEAPLLYRGARRSKIYREQVLSRA